MHVSYLTEIFDAFLSLYSSEEHLSNIFYFESLGGKKEYKEVNSSRKAVGSVFTYSIDVLLSCIGPEREDDSLALSLSFAQKQTALFFLCFIIFLFCHQWYLFVVIVSGAFLTDCL